MNAALRDLRFLSSIVTPGDAMHLLKPQQFLMYLMERCCNCRLPGF